MPEGIGPRQPQKRKANTRAAYHCPICQKGYSILENHLTECLSSFLYLNNDDNKLDYITEFEIQQVKEQVRNSLPVFHPPPPIPIESIRRNSENKVCLGLSFSVSVDSLDSILGQDCWDVNCLYCGKLVNSLIEHLDNCIKPNNEKLIGIEPIINPPKVKTSQTPIFKIPPKIPVLWNTIKKEKHIPVERLPKVPLFLANSSRTYRDSKYSSESELSIRPHTQRTPRSPHSTRSSPRSPNSPRSPRSPRSLIVHSENPPKHKLLSPRLTTNPQKVKEKITNIKERRWIHDAKPSGSHRKLKESNKKKERTTPFNLPLQELPAAPSPSEIPDNTVLKIPICTNAPTNSEISIKFPELDVSFKQLSEMANGTIVAIVSLENMSLCRMTPEGKTFADGQFVEDKFTHFTIVKKEGFTECKFKNVTTHKYLANKESFSNMNNYLTRFRKKQYNCLFFSKGSKEVLIGTGQERSMFKVFEVKKNTLRTSSVGNNQ